MADERDRRIADLERQLAELRQAHIRPCVVPDEFGSDLQALRITEERYRTMFNMAAVGMGQTTVTDGRFVAVNQKLAEITGYSVEELLNRTYLDITHPEDVAPNAQLVAELLSDQRQSYSLEKRYIRKDGSVIQVRTTISLVRDSSGVPLHTIGIIENITERNQAEEALRQSEARLRLITNALPALISYIDADFRYRLANQSYERWFNRAPDTIVGMLVIELIGENAFRQVQPHMEKALAGETVEYEEWIPYVGGQRYIRAVYAPDRSDDGTVRGFTALVEDLTRRRRAEEQLSASEERLRQVITASPFPLMLHADDGEILHLSRKWTELTGYTAEQIQTRFDWTRLAYGERAPEVDRAINRGFASEGSTAAREWALRTNSGEVRFWEFYNVALSSLPDGRRLRLSVAADITERKRALDDLQEKEQKLRVALQLARMGVWETDLATGTVRASETAEDLFGLPHSGQHTMQEFTAHVHPEDRSRVEGSSLEAAAKGSDPATSFRVLMPDGSTCWLAAYGETVFNDAGDPLRVIGATIDVTPYKRAEAAVRESEQRYRFLAEGLPQLVWTRDAERRIDYVNEHLLEFFGEGPGDLEAVNWTAKVHPEDLAILEGALERTRRGEAYEIELRFRRKDGAYRWMLARSQPLTLPDGTLRSIGTAVDIDDRKRAENALRESEERQRLAADAGNIGLWDWDMPSNRVVWSERVYGFHGLEPGTFDGTMDGFSKLVHPQDVERVQDAIRRALDERLPYQLEFRIVRPNGEVRWLATSARVVYGERGQPVRMLGATVDTTERHEAEEELRRKNAELEEFAYIASHDLQEPLRMVNIFTQKLLRSHVRPGDTEAQEFAEFIGSGVKRMEGLIRDLLSYSRTIQAESARGRTASLAAAVAQSVALLTMQIEEAGASIQPGDLPEVPGDESQFAAVFQNLISNSLKYRHPERTPTVQISAEQSDGSTMIAVRDNGIGFDPAYADRIFGLFKRLHTNEYPGTGLGLAICKRVIERHGGRIWAESQPGQGSTFYFSVPNVR